MAQLKRISLVSLIALGMALPAAAQDGGPQTAPQPEDQDRMSRDVVVVTAQKREETVQDTAVAVTAITSQMRDEIGLTTVQDYTNFAPGLTYSTSNDRLGMRGVTGYVEQLRYPLRHLELCPTASTSRPPSRPAANLSSSSVSRSCAARRAPCTVVTPSAAR